MPALAETPAAPANIPTSPDVEAAPAEQGSAEQGPAIVVTGTRSRQGRTLADSPVPIDVIDAKSLQQTGRTGLKEILGNLVPSLTMPALGGGGTSASVKPISIRGFRATMCWSSSTASGGTPPR
jgi:iron complex outermembrane receptor protein